MLKYLYFFFILFCGFSFCMDFPKINSYEEQKRQYKPIKKPSKKQKIFGYTFVIEDADGSTNTGYNLPQCRH